MKNIIKHCSDRCDQKPGNLNRIKNFISILISLLFYDEITSGEFFPAKVKIQDSD